MSQYQRIFKYEVLSPDGPVDAAEAVSAVFPACDGQVGVLADRMPLAAVLGAGALRFERPDGTVREYFVAGGFAQVHNGMLTILAEQCLPAAELNRQAAWEELQRARAAAARGRGRVARLDDELLAARRKFNMVRRLMPQEDQTA
jgi:F-type H+-transporting ATPase subunit epsilon